MTRWSRAKGPMLCGYDRSCVIQAGDPIYLIGKTQMTRVLVRCANHADVPVPDEVYTADVESRLEIPDFTRVGRLARDVKLAQAGEVE